ncbi:hypothetical protein LF41_3073 [Lysobacter dokdonensis DS-58]|uniref:STAS/SEC14 domain-containing protein n=2 Tax=Noviluteimonas TaxID=3382693 RepID=A0A0A2WMA3_9GAMM|nr:hypothetical protein LF41_3073 [Lysobacter dokdonensis DS-58]
MVRVTYFGEVGFGERTEAIQSAASLMAQAGCHQLLVDFSNARVFEEGQTARADYLARMIVAPWPDHTRIAPLNAPQSALFPGQIGGAVRGIEVRGFFVEREAIDWLVGIAPTRDQSAPSALG